MFTRDLNRLDRVLKAINGAGISDLSPRIDAVEDEIKRVLEIAACFTNHCEHLAGREEDATKWRNKFGALHESARTFGFDMGPFGPYFEKARRESTLAVTESIQRTINATGKGKE